MQALKSKNELKLLDRKYSTDEIGNCADIFHNAKHLLGWARHFVGHWQTRERSPSNTCTISKNSALNCTECPKVLTREVAQTGRWANISSRNAAGGWSFTYTKAADSVAIEHSILQSGLARTAAFSTAHHSTAVGGWLFKICFVSAQKAADSVAIDCYPKIHSDL